MKITFTSRKPARDPVTDRLSHITTSASRLRPISFTSSSALPLLPVEPCVCCSPTMQAIQKRLEAADEATVTAGIKTAAAEAVASPAAAGHAAPSSVPGSSTDRILLTNIRIFDGLELALQEGRNILIEGRHIVDLPGVGETIPDAHIIDGGGRVALPGLIDAHWHSTLCALPQLIAMTADIGYIHLVAAREAGHTLLRGFTTVRDAGGPSFALKRAIDEHLVPGPRIFPSGAMISQTSGHGDFRFRHEVPRLDGAPLSHAEQLGAALIADGETEVLRRVREQLMLGASQIKLMAGGGVTSIHDPLDVTQYREAELRAAVEAAADWGTYVMVHVYTSQGIQRAIRAGVRSIEHGQLADEETVRLMADQGVWWSLQPFLADEDANKHDALGSAKQRQVAEGTVRAYELAKKHHVKTAWGTDILFSPANLPHHGRQLAKLTRFYDPLELLRIATGANGQLLQMSGPRSSYAGPIGILAPGALADLLIADGAPDRSLDFLTDPANNLRLIMKDGQIVKNTLD